MRNWKRFAAVMMAAATMVTGLTACGGNGTAGTSGNGDAANSGDENKVSDVEQKVVPMMVKSVSIRY